LPENPAMHLFYLPDVNIHLNLLGKEESWHCVRVLRLAEGDKISLTDGKGNWFDCVIEEPDPKHCRVRVINTRQDPEPHPLLHIAIAPTKSNDRLEWFLEKSTEIGISEITPLLTEHSERMKVKTERMEKVMIAAMKQSLKAWLPLIHEPVKFAQLVQQPFKGQKFIAYCEKEKTVELKDIYRPGEDAMILIGPEGDFSPAEVELAEKNGFIAVAMGRSRLRTETAGIVACHTINFMNQ
jgi:16S rRNA (uracil1498-N3)-methyltransferase